MKVIDLLNKIAKGEEVPEEIEFRGEQYSYYNRNYTYCDENNCDRWLFDDLYETIDILNDEVEILEDKTEEIEEIQADDNYCIHTELGSFKGRKMDIAFVNKFNELVRAINQIKKDFLAIGVDYGNDCDKETNCMTD